ncbi:MAG TPA: CBS domain-containing protein [Methanoregulaceae archaeon]|nr:CBS domain-containing protein [Methanoregulaceae archaeon]
MSIYTCCQKNVLSVKPDATVRFVAELMNEKNIGCVVITDNHKPVGIVTDRDMALRGPLLCDVSETDLIESIMTKDVKVVRKDTGIFEGIQEMKSAGVRRMPVVDASGRLVGLITLDDLIRLLSREMSDISRIIGKESSPQL